MIKVVASRLNINFSTTSTLLHSALKVTGSMSASLCSKILSPSLTKPSLMARGLVYLELMRINVIDKVSNRHARALWAASSGFFAKIWKNLG